MEVSAKAFKRVAWSFTGLRFATVIQTHSVESMFKSALNLFLSVFTSSSEKGLWIVVILF